MEDINSDKERELAITVFENCKLKARLEKFRELEIISVRRNEFKERNKLALSWDKLSQRYASWTRSSSFEIVLP